MDVVIRKTAIVDGLLAYLERQLAGAVAASRDAAAYATDGESRAQSQWDTQGIEASYLAAGQAGQARDWIQSIQQIRSNRDVLIAPKERVVLGAIVSVAIEDFADWYFIVPSAGGHELEIDGQLITTITPHAPIATAMTGLSRSKVFKLDNGLTARVADVL